MISAQALALFTVLISGSALLGTFSFGADGAVTTVTQQDEVTLFVKSQNQLVFNAVAGPQVDHLHIYVDGELVGQTRQLKGGFTLDDIDLPRGKHFICIKVANRAHVATGAEDCVNINIG